jgi:hypothetical protein
MAGSTFQAPIHLDPTQDSSQQTAFINQNFQALAAALEASSFRIAKTIDGTFPAVTVAGSTNNWSFGNATATIPHGLNIIPMPFGTFFDGSTYIQLPDTKLGGGGSTPIWNEWRVRTDAVNVYLDIYLTVFNQSTGTNLTTNAFPAKILLIQQTAN